MAQEITNRAQWRSFSFKTDRVCVSECVGVNALFDSGSLCKSWKETPHVRVVDMSPSQRAEERRLPRGDEPRSDVEPPLDDHELDNLYAELVDRGAT